MSQPLLSLNDVAIGYDPAAPVLTHVKASLLPGARIGVLGENGAGKSTLLKCLVGDLEPLDGELIRGQHSSIGYFAQHQLENLDPDQSALSGLQRAHPDQREQWCRDYLGTWGFPRDKVERPVRTLSGGERARLVLARIAATQPAILVLDEPTNHLDLEMREALALALQDFSGALVIVAHDRSLLARTVDEFWLVEDGSVERLKGTLDTYARAHNRATLTLAARQADGADGSAPPGRATPTADSAVGNRRKAQRQAAAARREREKPLRNRAAKLERRIEELGAALADVEQRLADPEIYRNLSADELDELLKEAGKLRKKRDDAEQEWLATAEELEAVQAT
jgi:ATP-binding cassette subfamily F protein 3